MCLLFFFPHIHGSVENVPKNERFETPHIGDIPFLQFDDGGWKSNNYVVHPFFKSFSFPLSIIAEGLKMIELIIDFLFWQPISIDGQVTLDGCLVYFWWFLVEARVICCLPFLASCLCGPGREPRRLHAETWRCKGRGLE